MMKGKDLNIYWVLLIISIVISILFGNKFEDYSYSNLITFLSIIIGFEITSLSILFNNPLKKYLYDEKDKLYETSLHKLKDFYKFSIYSSLFSVIVLLIIPDSLYLYISKLNFHITKQLLIIPILVTTIYCTLKLCDIIFKFFVYPTNK